MIVYSYSISLPWLRSPNSNNQKPLLCQQTLPAGTTSMVEKQSVTTVCLESLIQIQSGELGFYIELLITGRNS